MKQTIAMSILSLFSASLFVVSFSSCTKDVREEQQMTAIESRNAASMNLEKQYRADLHALNNSGAHGTATLWLKGNMLTVQIDATGLEPNKVHPQHIHGYKDNNRNSTCPSMSADTNGDGLVDLAEGLPSYGPVLLDLGPFPTADSKGEVHFSQTFEISSDLLPLQNRAIVLHGLTVMGQYWPTLPVACGQVQPWGDR